MTNDELRIAYTILVQAWVNMEEAAELPIKNVQNQFPKLDRMMNGRLDEAASHLFQANECLELVLSEIKNKLKES